VEVTEDAAPPDARTAQVAALVEELAGLGYARPLLDEEITDAETGKVLAVAEAFWPDGLQVGQGKPVVLELDPEEADLPRLTELGCEVFTSADALLGYVQRLGEVASGDRTSAAGFSEQTGGDDTLETALFVMMARSKAELQYDPVQLREMVHALGALDAVRRILNAPTPSDGFRRLWEEQRLEFSVETIALRFPALFAPSELATARQRLRDAGAAEGQRALQD
jgi:hypothetical protein